MRPNPLLTGLAALLVTLGFAACDRSGAPEDQARQPAPAAASAPVEGPWRLEASATSGSALVFDDADGVERLRLICRRGPAEFVVQAPDVTPIGSEERFTLGLGEQLFTLVADVASGLPFVEAKAPLTSELIAALRGGGPVAANYGATNLGPHPAPEGAVREAFVHACEQALD